MNKKIKTRIVRKVRRQYNYVGNRSSYLHFNYEDINSLVWGWPDWTMD
jgi:hypothetical protein